MKKAALTICILILASISIFGCSQKKEPEAAQTSTAAVSDTTETTNENNTEVTEQETNKPVSETPVADEVKGYFFKHNEAVVGMGQKAEPILADIGEPLDKFEAPSCAFEGIDRIYYYNGFEMFTYPVKDVDYVLSVNLTDDSVQTNEGVYLGMAFEDLISAYGEADSQEDGLYKYIKDGTSLSFILEDGFITSITYNFIVE